MLPMPRPRAIALLSLLLPLAALLSPALAQTPGPVENVDYVVIEGGEPLAPLDGRIEVVEVFSYGCIHCYRLQGPVDAWLSGLPEDVRFTYLPAAFAANDAFARGFFVAQAQGLQPRTHHALFEAVHETSALPRGGASFDAVARWYAAHGALSQPDFLAAMASPATDEKMNQARAFAARSGVEGTPTLIINGRYRVQSRTLQGTLDTAGQLIARERAAR